ncbi:MAG: hypothetical protein K2J70_00055 [Muribaculaceae bacterium]|nr:hypothetical protein [Muribaculaceae bacterium]
MNKEQQDLLWSVLSKEERESKRNFIGTPSNNDFSRGCKKAFSEIFGHHNLTSSTEPEDMLMVERKYIQEMYADGVGTHYLINLFGDKCLPDTPDSSNISNIGKDELEHRLEQTVQASVQVEPKPKFKVGDKVKVSCREKDGTVWDSITDGRIVTISGHHIEPTNGLIIYEFKEGIRDFAEHWLEPYTEEKEPIVSTHDTMDDTKQTMEEKELDLGELIKDSIGETFFNASYGDVMLKRVDEICMLFEISEGQTLTPPRIFLLDTGFIPYYPSKESFLKYPLDAHKAWDEWQNERKPKRWRAKDGGTYWLIPTDGSPIVSNKEHFTEYQNKLYEFGNYFRTEEEAHQAAEAVRETLMKFHSNYTEK